MKKYIIIFTLVATALSSCKMKKMNELVEPGEVRISVSSVKVTPKQSPATKATSIDGFQVNSMIGIFSAIDNETDYPVNILSDKTIKDNNRGYVQTIASNYWNPLAEAIFFDSYQEITLFSYHPYSSQQYSSTSIVQSEELGTLIKYNIKQKQNTADSLLLSDLMYAKCQHVSDRNIDANLPFEHKLAKVTFSIIKGASWGTSPVKLTNIAIEGDQIRTEANLKLIDGTLIPTPSTKKNKIEWEAPLYQPISINNITATNVDLIVIPGPAKGTQITFIANGLKYQYTLSKEENFEVGVNYVYKVKLNTNADVEPIVVEASIGDWDVRSDIIIEPK